MANQVIKPFGAPICYGYFVTCDCGDGYMEPEGTIYFDDMPKIGDVAILSDGKQWKVISQPHDFNVTMRQV